MFWANFFALILTFIHSTKLMKKSKKQISIFRVKLFEYKVLKPNFESNTVLPHNKITIYYICNFVYEISAFIFCFCNYLEDFFGNADIAHFCIIAMVLIATPIGSITVGVERLTV